MSVIELAGDISSAQTHFALYGLSKIARSVSEKQVLLAWTQDPKPKANLIVEDLSIEVLSEQVIQIARNWSSSWTKVRVEYGAGEFSPFSPRFKTIDQVKFPNDWPFHQETREYVLDELNKERDFLALEFIHALGEAAYWRSDTKDPRPDDGASRFEMKTRNKGAEFVRDRFSIMCEELSTWSIDDVTKGISGLQVNDSIGKNAIDSRTSTGLTPPGPADVAFSFVALLGIVLFPPTRLANQISFTPAVHPHGTIHPSLAVLPCSANRLTLERYENILSSAEWETIVKAFAGDEVGSLLFAQSKAALTSLGIEAAAVFTIKKGGTSSAPERNLDIGSIRLLK